MTDTDEPREVDVDPAAISRLDGREEWDRLGMIQRMTVGTTPDGTPVVLTETPKPTSTEMLTKVWAYTSIESARADRDYQITRGYGPRDDADIRDV